MSTLTFLGAARTVTGSKHLLAFTSPDGSTRRVLVDCGLFQGLKDLRLRNWESLPVDPEAIDAVILTHAHIDHSGYLPGLVAGGFRGRIFCTPGTAELCGLVLPDAARLQEEDARHANKRGYSKHRPAMPLFTEADAYRALGQLQPVGYERTVPVAPGLEVEFINAGHLLGSAYARARLAGPPPLEVLFGGDLGRYGRPVLPDPAPVASADVLLLESTYGDRDHDPDDQGARLARIVSETAARGGKVIVPAFAIGRVEEVLYWLRRIEQRKEIPVLPVYVDSPMAVSALRFYEKRGHELDEDARSGRGDVSAFATDRFRTIELPAHSKELTASKGPAIVVSSSGMATGGRVLHHLAAALPDARHTILFVGYQAAGTRGRQLLEGVSRVRIHGVDVPVAARVESLDSMSAHADRSEILRWLRGFTRPPRVTYLVHGEPAPMAALRHRIEGELGWHVEMPEYRQTVELGREAIK
jgi:metallo-beta-lactamase family protein